MKRKVEQTTRSVILIGIILGVLVIINGIAQQKFVRWDLTENKQYTISDATKKILSDLDDIVNVKLYFSKKLPPAFMLKERRIKDILDEYRAYSNGKVVVRQEDPSSDKELENKVHSVGIPQVQMTYREKDKVEVKNGYFGMAVFYSAKKEVFPIVPEETSLEYDLTSAIKKVTTEKVPTVGFSTGHGERDLQKDYSFIQGYLKQQCETVIVDTKKDPILLQDLDALIIAGPREDFSKRELFEIDQFLMQGGKLIVLMDMVNIDFSMGLMAKPITNNLLTLLEHYGVRVNSDLVLDRYNDRLTYSESPDNRIQYVTTVNYPFFVKTISQNFDVDNPVMRGLEFITFPWPSSIDLLGYRLKEAEIIELVKSSQFAWEQKGHFNLNPKQKFQVAPDQERQFLLAAIVANEFTSYYKGKEIPPKETPEDEQNPDQQSEQEEDEQVIEQSPKTHIFVAGTSNLVTTDVIRRFEGNAVFFLNTVDWLTQGDTLINIRTRSVAEHPIRELSDKTIAFLRFINIFGGTIIIIVLGLLIISWRRREKKLYESVLHH